MSLIYIGRGDPFAYWFSTEPIAHQRECTEEEKRELEELKLAQQRLQELLREIDLRNTVGGAN